MTYEAKGKNIGKWKLDYPSLHCLNDMLLVKGLTVDIITISQLGDQDL